MRRIEHGKGKFHPGVVQKRQQSRYAWGGSRLGGWRGERRLQAARAQHTTIGHAERHRLVARRLDRRAVARANRERRLEPQTATSRQAPASP